jgi:hypothetical protein
MNEAETPRQSRTHRWDLMKNYGNPIIRDEKATKHFCLQNGWGKL